MTSIPSSSSDTLHGSCFCEQTSYTLHLLDYSTSPPSPSLTLSAYCHCSGCQRMNGAPFVHTTHWKHQAVVWGQVKPYKWEQKEGKFKLTCANCKSPIGTWNEKKEEYSLWPSTLSRDSSSLKPIGLDRMKPTAHIFYPFRQMDINDNLGRWEGYEGSSKRVA